MDALTPASGTEPPIHSGRAHVPAASRLQLPPGQWATLLDGLCARFPRIAREQWQDRFARGLVRDAHDAPLPADAPYVVGALIRYFREVTDEAPIAARERLVHVDAHLVVVDKPHGLPVMPAGRHVEHTLLTRLVRRLGNPDLVPLHRLDRETAGLVLFSADRDTRAAYHALFRDRLVDKHYEALAAPLPGHAFPLLRASHIARGEPFFRMREVDGAAPNATTRIDVLGRGARRWRYALQPVSGRKHQLRVQMAALGAPIENDRWYPTLLEAVNDEPTRPLQLLARSLSFVDPIDGAPRRFDSGLSLQPLDG